MDVRLRYANLLTIEGGMVARNLGFADWQSALEAAGLREYATAALDEKRRWEPRRLAAPCRGWLPLPGPARGGGVVQQLRGDPALMRVDPRGVVLVTEGDNGFPLGGGEAHGLPF